MKIIKVIELNDRIIFCDDIIETYKENNYCPVRYHLLTKNGTYRINDKDYEKIKEYLLSLNNEVEILEEEKKIPEKLKIEQDNNDEEYIMGKHCEKISYSISDIFIANKINEIIDYLDYLKSKGE